MCSFLLCLGYKEKGDKNIMLGKARQWLLVASLSLIVAFVGDMTVLAAPVIRDIEIDSQKGVVERQGDRDNIITHTYNMPQSRWEFKDGFWTFYYADGTQPVGDVKEAEDGTLLYYYDWQMIDGKWYAFDWNSTMVTGLVKDAGYNNQVYYLDNGTGEMLTGRQVIMSECYMFDETSGHLICECTE